MLLLDMIYAIALLTYITLIRALKDRNAFHRRLEAVFCPINPQIVKDLLLYFNISDVHCKTVFFSKNPSQSPLLLSVVSSLRVFI